MADRTPLELNVVSLSLLVWGPGMDTPKSLVNLSVTKSSNNVVLTKDGSPLFYKVCSDAHCISQQGFEFGCSKSRQWPPCPNSVQDMHSCQSDMQTPCFSQSGVNPHASEELGVSFTNVFLSVRSRFTRRPRALVSFGFKKKWKQILFRAWRALSNLQHGSNLVRSRVLGIR